jgi:hypothetical protein
MTESSIGRRPVPSISFPPRTTSIFSAIFASLHGSEFVAGAIGLDDSSLEPRYSPKNLGLISRRKVLMK